MQVLSTFDSHLAYQWLHHQSEWKKVQVYNGVRMEMNPFTLRGDVQPQGTWGWASLHWRGSEPGTLSCFFTISLCYCISCTLLQLSLEAPPLSNLHPWPAFLWGSPHLSCVPSACWRSFFGCLTLSPAPHVQQETHSFVCPTLDPCRLLGFRE